MAKERLVAIRAKSFRAWFRANLKDYAKDIAAHGADCGYPWLTYNADGARLMAKYRDDIWTMLADDAEDQGVSVPTLISHFRREDMTATPEGFDMLLVWYAAEKVAHEMTDGAEA